MGLIAEDVQKALAQTRHNDLGVVKGQEGQGNGPAIVYSELIPVLIKAVQELSQQVAELKAGR